MKFIKKHGHSLGNYKTRSKTYRSWERMRERCNRPKHKSYAYYGGRGIKICERWNDFNNFLSDMGERPEGKTIDRINVNGNYEPSNCKWSTSREQRVNQRPRRKKW